MIRKQMIDDLVRHQHERIGRSINNTAELFDNDDDRLLFILAMCGHILAEASNGLLDEPTPAGRRVELRPENMVITAFVLASLHDPEALKKLDLHRMIAKTERLVARMLAV